MNILGAESERAYRFTLMQELQSLRKGGGLTSWKLSHAAKLRQAIAAKLGVDSNELPIALAYSYLLEAFATLGESIEARAVRNAFAIGIERNRRSLMERRADFAQQFGRHPDTIEGYENRAIEEIVTSLLGVDGEMNHLHGHHPALGYKKEISVARAMIAQGLAELYGLGSHAAEVLRCFEQGHSPYLDATVEVHLIPSKRGPNWYTYRLQCLFRTHMTHFRIAIVTSAYAGEVLMASGVVDDVIKLNKAQTDYEREMPGILENCTLTANNVAQGTQQLLLFNELSTEARQQLLQPVWQIDSNSCRIIEAVLPKEGQGLQVLYEYRWAFDLSVAERYAYWCAPALMYLNTLTVDVSRFPGRDAWQFFIRPFLGTMLPGAMGPAGDRYTLPANGWIMQGHGVAIIWQEAAVP